MAPGVAPPRRAAAACPNSWKPADSTVTSRISSTRPGLAKASWVAEASPLTISTHQQMARKAAVTATTISGLNSAGKRRREFARTLRIRDGVPEPHAQERVGLLDLGLRAVGQPQEAQGEKL